MSEKLEELINLANKNIADSNFEKAMKVLEEAYEIDDKNNEVLKNLGLCYYNLQKNTKAQEYFTKALNVSPDDATSLYYAGAINILNMDLETAKLQLEKVLELRPEYLDAYKNLGVIYFNLKQMDQPSIFFKKECNMLKMPLNITGFLPPHILFLEKIKKQ